MSRELRRRRCPIAAMAALGAILLAGAPAAKAAGVEMHAKLGDRVANGQPLITVHAQSPGEMEYALAFARANTDAIEIDES